MATLITGKDLRLVGDTTVHGLERGRHVRIGLDQ